MNSIKIISKNLGELVIKIEIDLGRNLKFCK